ncbi:hypothetical protein FRB98_002598 [Tulasnella sp. 332]|nr:hypothetical protein FRB98_002598 [Tulasnella sp. 332]
MGELNLPSHIFVFMVSAKRTILIIGGGGAGVAVALSLSQSLNAAAYTLQLVTERSFSPIYPGMLRALTTSEGSFDERALVTYEKLFAPGKPGEVIVGSVASIQDGTAYLAGGQALPYDWLVLATGTTWEGPLALPLDYEMTRRWINDWQTKLANAKDIVVIGGGAIGIELCGEIRHFLSPDKKITLVHAQDELLNPAYPSKYRKALLEAVKGKDINVFLNDRANVPQGHYTSIRTENGVEIPADLVIPTRGGKLNTAFLSSFDSTILTPNGSVKVLPTLQVPLANGKSNVFAVGDIIESQQQKMVSKVPAQASVVVANILSALGGAPMTQEYKGFMEAILVPLGPKSGRSYLPMLWGIILGDFLTSTLKGKGLFVDQSRQGYIAPQLR